MNLHTSLKNLGLSEKEAAVYLALLQGGEATAYQIAKRSGLKKPTTYVILDELMSRSAVKKTMKPRASLYRAVDPVELFVEARSRIEQAEDALPELRALAQKNKKSITASYYEGIAGIKELYKQMLSKTENRTCIGFYAHQQDTPQELREFWPSLNAKMIKQNTKLKGVTTKDTTTRDYFEYKKMPKEFLNLKGLSPDEYSSNVSIEVYDDYTQIVSHRYMQALLIDNPDVAKVMKQIFEMVWKRDE